MVLVLVVVMVVVLVVVLVLVEVLVEVVVIDESRKETGYGVGCRQGREVHILSGLVCSVTNLLYLEDDAVAPLVTDSSHVNSTSLQSPLI